MMQQMVSMIGPDRAATSPLSTIPHQPALAEAFRNGPLAVWRHAFEQIWAHAEQRGEVRPGLSGSVVAESTSALMVQRWLLTGEPVTRPTPTRCSPPWSCPLVRARADAASPSAPPGSGGGARS